MTALRQGLAEVLGGEHIDLSPAALEPFDVLRAQFEQLDEQVKRYDLRIRPLAGQNEAAARVMKLPCVGPLTSTALVASLGQPRHFRAGRDYAVIASYSSDVPRASAHPALALLISQK